MTEKKEAVKLTAMETLIAEKTAGLSLATLEDPNFPKVGLIGAMAWVVAKRSDATLKFEDFMNDHTLDECLEISGLADVAEEV